jgi:putative transposase
VVGLHRSVYDYKLVKDDRVLRQRIRDIAEFTFSCDVRAGTSITRRCIESTARMGCICAKKRPRRNVSAAHRERRPTVSSIDQCWSMDFVADNLFNGRRIRALTLVDNLSRECLAIHVDQVIKGKDVVQVMKRLRLFADRCPKRIQVDGPEFISKDLDKWAYENGVMLDFSRPEKPTDNALIESFNGNFRDECLNVHWFLLSVDDAKKKIEAWRKEYNSFRPHSSLGDLTPEQFREQLPVSQKSLRLAV